MTVGQSAGASRRARLVLINGPPGIGKSMVARLYQDDHPLALNLDLDVVRALIGRWREAPQRAGLLAREVAVAMARTHLSAGHDVVVPQYLGRLAFIEQLYGVARWAGADFRELALMDTEEASIRRFQRRTSADRPADSAHLVAADELDRMGGEPRLRQMYADLLAVIGARPATQVIDTRDGYADDAYQAVRDRLG